MNSGNREGGGTATERASSVEFHEPSGTYRTRFRATDRLASEAVVEAVAAATQSDPLDLPPIYDAVDPDALSNLFEPSSTGSRRFQGTVTFEYADHLVTVEGEGTITLEPFGERGRSAE